MPKHLTKILLAQLLIYLIVLVSPQALAKSKTYLYRNRADWVKLVGLKKKQLGNTVLLHPISELSTEALQNMLLSITLNRSALFSKDVKEVGVFTDEEAGKYASYIVQALKKAAPNQVVNASIVHKRPHFIIRADYLTIFNIYVTDQGVHFYFNKLFARLDGDYEQASQMDRALSHAKSARVTIKPMPGQRLAYHDGHELIMSPGFNFADNSIIPRKEPIKSAHQLMEQPSKSAHSDGVATNTGRDTKSRMKELEDLKKSGLVSQEEYRTKKSAILDAL